MRKLPLVTDRRYYVSLGDSQSRNAADYTGVASRFYERLTVRDSSLKMVPLATDGATAATVRYVQLPRLREMDVEPSVVTITLGVSDLSRLAFGDAAGVCRELKDHGKSLLSALRTTAPRAVLLFSTLYDPMDGTDATLATAVQTFNEAIRTLATACNGRVAEIHAAFSGHGANVGDPLSSNELGENPDLYLCAGPDLSPVPNHNGASVFAELLLNAYHAALTEETTGA